MVSCKKDAHPTHLCMLGQKCRFTHTHTHIQLCLHHWQEKWAHPEVKFPICAQIVNIFLRDFALCTQTRSVMLEEQRTFPTLFQSCPPGHTSRMTMSNSEDFSFSVWHFYSLVGELCPTSKRITAKYTSGHFDELVGPMRLLVCDACLRVGPSSVTSALTVVLFSGLIAY